MHFCWELCVQVKSVARSRPSSAPLVFVGERAAGCNTAATQTAKPYRNITGAAAGTVFLTSLAAFCAFIVFLSRFGAFVVKSDREIASAER